MKRIHFAIWVVILVLSGCREQKLKPIDDTLLGREYFPVSVGSWWVYQVDSILYDLQKNGVIHDTVHVMVKQVITDTFPLGDDVMAYKMERFQRSDEASPWQALDSWWISQDEVGAWSNEGNILFQKLAFPVKKGLKWFGNAKIGTRVAVKVRGDLLEKAFEGWEYKYLSVDEPDQIGGQTFGQVATVLETDNAAEFTPVIALRQAMSKYAKNVGLIYKKWTLLDDIDKEPNFNTPFEERAEEGFILEQTLLDYHIQ